MSNRILGLLGLGVRRVLARLTGPAPGRTLISLFGVALAVAVLVIVTGLSLGLAGSATIQSDDVNYWIVPEEGQSGVTPLAYENAKLGSVHETSAKLRDDERVDHASPVAVQLLRLTDPDSGNREWVIALGIIPSAEGFPLAGVETEGLDARYPYYANGTYNGTWTGELLVSPAVADAFALDTGDELTTNATDRSLHVVDITAENPSVGPSEAPVVLMHLAELQALAGTTNGDQAAQILVITDAEMQEDLEGVYPRTTVETRSGLFDLSVTADNLPLAMAVAAGLVALVIGIAFVATMMGLELTASRASLALLTAVGFSRRSVALLLLTETITITLLGGLLGVVLGAVGIAGINAGLGAVVNLPGVATFEPFLIGYGLAAAVAVGVASVVYPLYIAWRTETLAELTG